jgi:hypothetical protein
MTRLPNALSVALAALLALASFDAADARTKKKPQPRRDLTADIVRDYDGTPIIMRGLPPRRAVTEPQPEEQPTPRRSERPRKGPRGSGTYIPPPVPSPDTPRAQVAPTPEPYRPPRIESFGDRVTKCIHSYPLNAGVGNNPTDQQAYIRQCAN